jgi:hypothetical protein
VPLNQEAILCGLLVALLLALLVEFVLLSIMGLGRLAMGSASSSTA